jgi:formylmethanofuran dehydrogenase subunit E
MSILSFINCDDCKEVEYKGHSFNVYDVTDGKDRTVCAKCFGDTYLFREDVGGWQDDEVKCDDCGKDFHADDLANYEGEVLCDECAEKIAQSP